MPNAEEPDRRLGFGAAWWVAIAFSLAMIAAGAVIGFVGPRLFPPHAAAPRAPAALAIRPGAVKEPASASPTRIGPP